MARLNEIPAPAPESLESIKRRFIRQNREIARVNSNQSIRIRNLETEISRLLAENIAIREEAISARAEAEKWRASQRLNKEVLRMKGQLEAKLSEVNALVEELGVLPDKIARRSSHKRRREGFVSELVKQSEEKEARGKPGIADQEGRLPAILEDKCYPRRTLEQMEIKQLAGDPTGNSLESPELGPPPIAHFDDPEPLTFDAARSPRRTSTELIEESEKSINAVSTTIESKRKRRTSSLLSANTIEEIAPHAGEQNGLTDSEIITLHQGPKVGPAITAPTQKAGAKRKLEISELEDTGKATRDTDDFVFLRKPSNTAAARSSRFSRPSSARSSVNKTDVEQPLSPEEPVHLTRKILAPKSTNSPAKRLPVAHIKQSDADCDRDEDHKPEKRMVSRIRTRPAKIEIPAPEAPARPSETRQPDEALLDPKTPGDELATLLSPPSNELLSKHQPKEMTITNSVEDVLNGSIGRGSRRARVAVSYAPPKLNTKLRREGKELVGAVEGISKMVGGQSQPHVRTASGDHKQDSDVATEASEEIRSAKSGGQRGTFDMGTAHRRANDPVSPTITRQGTIDERASKSAAVDQAVNKLSIYDPPDSPVVDGAPIQRQAPSGAEPGPAKAAQSKLRLKRHSSVSDVYKDISSTDASAKGHERSASASRAANVPQRVARRETGVEPYDHDGSNGGGLRTRTSTLTHRRSMLV